LIDKVLDVLTDEPRKSLILTEGKKEIKQTYWEPEEFSEDPDVREKTRKKGKCHKTLPSLKRSLGTPEQPKSAGKRTCFSSDESVNNPPASRKVLERKKGVREKT